MDKLLDLLLHDSLEIDVIEPSEESHKNICRRGVIIIGHGYAGMAFAMDHLIHSCAPILLVHDVNEVGCRGHVLLNSEEPSHTQSDVNFFQHLVQETTFEITALKQEIYESICYEYFEPRHQHIKNYRQPKVGRLNTKPKPIWWYRNHQRL